MRTSSTKTRPAVTRRRVELIPSKAFVASAENPAGPVTFASRPGGSPFSTVVRTCSTADTSKSESPSARIGTLTTAAVPSGDHATGEMPETPSIDAARSVARVCSTAARPRAPSPSALRKTATAGVCSPEGNPLAASSTLTDSAPPGRKVDGSLCCDCSNRPASGPSAAAPSNQTANTANLRLLPTTSRERMSLEALISLYQSYTHRTSVEVQRVANHVVCVLKLYRDGSNSIQEVIHAHSRRLVGSDPRLGCRARRTRCRLVHHRDEQGHRPGGRVRAAVHHARLPPQESRPRQRPREGHLHRLRPDERGLREAAQVDAGSRRQGPHSAQEGAHLPRDQGEGARGKGRDAERQVGQDARGAGRQGRRPGREGLSQRIDPGHEDGHQGLERDHPRHRPCPDPRGLILTGARGAGDRLERECLVGRRSPLGRSARRPAGRSRQRPATVSARYAGSTCSASCSTWSSDGICGKSISTSTASAYAATSSAIFVAGPWWIRLPGSVQ